MKKYIIEYSGKDTGTFHTMAQGKKELWAMIKDMFNNGYTVFKISEMPAGPIRL